MLYRRVIVPVITAALFLTAVGSIASVLVPGRDWQAMTSSLIGTALAAVWPRRARLFFPVTLLLGAVVSLAMTFPDLGSPMSNAQLFFISFAPLYLSAFGGWLILHEQEPWPVAVIAAIAVLARANVSRQYETSFPLFVAAVLVLVVAAYAPDARRFWRALPAAVCALVLVALSWQLPVFRAGAQVPQLSFVTVPVGAPTSTPNSLDLAGPFRPTNLPLYYVSVSGSYSPTYWQSAVFDRFNGHSWGVSEGLQRELRPDDLLTPPVLAQMNVIASGVVQVLRATTDVISPGTPISTGLPSMATYTPGGITAVRLRSDEALRQGEVYLTQGAPTFNAPLDLTQRQLYLQLPSEPERVVALVTSLTHSIRDPLSKAGAIEAFLRNSGNFVYDPTTGSPTDQDAVDAFLFQSRRGYCSQFATAFAILAREAGLPSRVVSGYDGGESLGGGTYIVRARDAHSWDQIYLPGRGWVTFDPTPGFAQTGNTRSWSAARTTVVRKFPRLPPAIHQPAGAKAGSSSQATRSHALRPPAATSILFIAGGSVGLLTLVLFAAYALRPRPIGELYASLARRDPASRTPFEFAERFRGTRQYADVSTLARLHADHVYGGLEASPDAVRIARRAWLRIMLRSLVGRK